MPWKERSAMEEKRSFIMEYLADGTSVTELCQAFGISRTLGYKYIRRYLEEGSAGLEERSRAPRRVWRRSSPLVVKTDPADTAQVSTVGRTDDPRLAGGLDL